MAGLPISTTFRRTGLVLAGVSLLIAAFLVAPTDGAKLKKVASTIRIGTIDADHISGTVVSSRGACVGNRKVRLHGANEKKQFGSTFTDRHGHYRINVRLGLGAGVYYADVHKEVRRGKENGHRVTFQCRGDESRPLTL